MSAVLISALSSSTRATEPDRVGMPPTGTTGGGASSLMCRC